MYAPPTPEDEDAEKPEPLTEAEKQIIRDLANSY